MTADHSQDRGLKLLSEAMASMVTDEGVVPGSLLEQIVTGEDRSGERFHAFIVDLVGCSTEEAHAIAARFGEALEMGADVVEMEG